MNATKILLTSMLLATTALAGCAGSDGDVGAAVTIENAPQSAGAGEPIDISWRVDLGPTGDDANATVDVGDQNATFEDSKEYTTALVWGNMSVEDPSSPDDYGNESESFQSSQPEAFNASIVVAEAGTVYVRAYAQLDGNYAFSDEVTIEIDDNGTTNGTTVVIRSAPVGALSGYEPEPLTIQAGQSVVWKNEDDEVHTATADDNAWDTGDVAAGQSSEPMLFESPGEFTYHCEYHSETMRGTIVVE